MCEINEMERFAFLKAAKSAVDARYKESEEYVKAQLMDMYHDSGVDRQAGMVGDEKVGTLGISYTKEGPVCYHDQTDALCDYLEQYGMTERRPKKGWEALFSRAGDSVVDKETGEIVPFLAWEGARPKCVQARGFEPAKVFQAFGSRLPEVSERLMLGGANGS